MLLSHSSSSSISPTPQLWSSLPPPATLPSHHHWPTKGLFIMYRYHHPSCTIIIYHYHVSLSSSCIIITSLLSCIIVIITYLHAFIFFFQGSGKNHGSNLLAVSSNLWYNLSCSFMFWFSLFPSSCRLNSIWQSPSWSSLEYGGKWKVIHLKNIFFKFTD